MNSFSILAVILMCTQAQAFVKITTASGAVTASGPCASSLSDAHYQAAEYQADAEAQTWCADWSGYSTRTSDYNISAAEVRIDCIYNAEATYSCSTE